MSAPDYSMQALSWGLAWAVEAESTEAAELREQVGDLKAELAACKLNLAEAEAEASRAHSTASSKSFKLAAKLQTLEVLRAA